MKPFKLILMIKRLVRLHFNPDNVKDFISIFLDNYENIKNSPGCVSLQLLQGVREEGLYFTESIWESEKDLETYRSSELFKSTWSKVKPLFNEKPLAWTLIIYNDERNKS